MQKPQWFPGSGRGKRIFRATHFLVNNFARDQRVRAACPPVCGSRPSRPNSAQGAPSSGFRPPISGLRSSEHSPHVTRHSAQSAPPLRSQVSASSPLFPLSPSQVSAFSPLSRPPRSLFHFELTSHPCDLFVHTTTQAPPPSPFVQPQVSGLSLHPSFHAPR